MGTNTIHEKEKSLSNYEEKSRNGIFYSLLFLREKKKKKKLRNELRHNPRKNLTHHRKKKRIKNQMVTSNSTEFFDL